MVPLYESQWLNSAIYRRQLLTNTFLRLLKAFSGYCIWVIQVITGLYTIREVPLGCSDFSFFKFLCTTNPWHCKVSRIWKLAKKFNFNHGLQIFQKMCFFGVISKFKLATLWRIFPIVSLTWDNSVFLNLLRKDLGCNKPVIFLPEQAHQLILWMIQDYIQALWTIFFRIKLGTTSIKWRYLYSWQFSLQ